jgi:hypothetical protein
MNLFHKALYSSARFLLLSLAFVLFWIGWQFKLTNEQLRSAINEIQWVAADSRPELRETLKQAKFASFEMRVAAKAFTEDLNSRENMLARRATQRAGGSAGAFFEHLSAEIVPALHQNLKSSNLLITRTDASLNAQLLPEATKVLASLRATTDALKVDADAVMAELVVLAKQGQVSLEAVNKVLASPEWIATLKNIERSTRNIADATAELPETAKSVEKILKTSAQWQKPILLAGLLATLARAFIP